MSAHETSASDASDAREKAGGSSGRTSTERRRSARDARRGGEPALDGFLVRFARIRRVARRRLVEEIETSANHVLLELGGSSQDFVEIVGGEDV